MGRGERRRKEAFFRLLAPASRGLLAMIFIVSGFSKVPQWSTVSAMMLGKGMSNVSLFLAAAILIEVLGGILLLTGNRARLAGAALFLYLVPVTLIFHNFWAYQGIDQQIQAAMFMKNLTIMGGLLHVVSLGAGPYSIDSLRERYQPEVQIRKGERPRLRRVA